VVCCTAITTDPGVAGALAAEGDVEHMEAFGVAWACARAGVPFAAVLGITNAVGPNAHAEWKANRAAAQAAAVIAARDWIARGAPELRR
jgi:purine-nucleoside phosphorylase